MSGVHTVCRNVASLRDATGQHWLVGPPQRADLTAFLHVADTTLK